MQCGQNIRSYQLHIFLEETATIVVGKLGVFTFPPGSYIYTGSARRNIEARVARHLKAKKPLRWHIDYLLAHVRCRMLKVSLSVDSECDLNQSTPGVILIPRFGSTDCSSHCGSHLKYLGL
ncbi:GIY-YIG nuclease family protein [Desulfoferrobacter suflitae]|uniref:GIY-YIG nuclease family protein n=1 Tax=Desulfoferrobacter suflitae TaxID=2865782 RepID=UPI00216493BF|nr:GIY-YIG nuclease family protein [Desulfoferrobacter suflitae]MCK8600123.1 GIY-YIG nuclease family protein [Desulfoferrobacter suflitae]